MLKKLPITLLLILGFLPVSGQCKKDTVLIMYPTVSAIETINYLYQEKILNTSNGDLHFLGVYHANERYDYTLSDSLLKAHPEFPFSLHPINPSIELETLFQKNSCTQEFTSLFENSIGVFFLGGPDLPPSIYKEPMSLLTAVYGTARHYMETSFIFHLLGGKQNNNYTPLLENNPDYVVLGICLGMQSINVGTGGTMVQDIPTEIYHQNSRDDVLNNEENAHRNYTFDHPSDTIRLSSYHFHQISFSRNNIFFKSIKNLKKHTPYVLSSHHQAIEKQGKGIEVAARSMDGKIIEAIYHNKYASVAGVQFHPENTGLYNSDLNYNITTDSVLNYNSFLMENDSYRMHENLWDMVNKMLEQSQLTPFQQD